MVSSYDIYEYRYNPTQEFKELFLFIKCYLYISLQGALFIFTNLYYFIKIIFHIFANYTFIIWDYSMHHLGRKKIIMDKTGKLPYLIRYFILFKEKQRLHFPFNIFIHHILKSDEEDLHDHPWGFYSIILYGGYYETTLTSKNEKTTTWYSRGSFRKVQSNHLHRIELHPNHPECWTLFIPFRREKKWGFFKKRQTNGPITRSAAKLEKSESFQWIPSDIYLKDKHP